MNQTEKVSVALTSGHTVILRRLTALESMQAVSYCGETPSKALLNMAGAVCAIGELDGVAQFPCRSRADFNTLASQLSDDDIQLIGIAQLRLSMLDDNQKKYLEAVISAVTSGAPLPEPASSESPDGSSSSVPLAT
jgi:hypothetical protein